MSIVQLPSGRWRLQIRRKTLKVDELHDTQEAAQAAEKEYLQAPAESTERHTIKELWTKYEASALFSDKKLKTQITERGRMTHVLAAFGNKTVFELEADTSLIYDYIDTRLQAVSERTKRKMSATSVRLEVAALASVVEFAKRRRIIRENFVSSISRPATKRRKRRVTDIEQTKLRISAEHWDLRIAMAARFTLLIRQLGCRPGELKQVLLADVDVEKRNITFRDTKNHTDRCIHIPLDAEDLIRLQLEQVHAKSPFLFWTISKKGEYVFYNYESGVKLLRKKDIIPKDYYAHAGRREYISRSIEANIPYGTIKKQTGHKSTAALEIYDEGLATADEMRAVFDRLANKVRMENRYAASKYEHKMSEEELDIFRKAWGINETHKG
ncbi:tyrosine-type recombinase/integrase [Burkholderia pseudomallei]|uniref:tyrosine-type recombinase/integrase n=1 Tax=Burkholderia pseudomallei TaxID=28450 RepID=UPI001A9D6661|nr:tyrosine-type recombinase/integrase [Burkholderia pseudomallei]MCA8374001.1 tyrosine-type recombinase/integrase [Burkholderia multivorans]QTB79297.1 tyrosine-type recombinase/integrase [Burkholderia pseudomallei]